jgi:hypothetical protein
MKLVSPNTSQHCHKLPLFREYVEGLGEEWKKESNWYPASFKKDSRENIVSCFYLHRYKAN